MPWDFLRFLCESRNEKVNIYFNVSSFQATIIKKKNHKTIQLTYRMNDEEYKDHNH